MNTVLADLQYWLRHQQAWCDFRNCHSAGWRYTLERWLWWPRILRTRPVPVPAHVPDSPVELHTMCHRGDWLLMMWMLKSFQLQAHNPWPVVIHLQAQLKPSAVAHIHRHFPGARIIARDDADRIVSQHFIDHGLTRCLHWRHSHGITHKLFDLHTLASTPRYAWVDADVLFFKPPDFLLSKAAGRLDTQYFQRDHTDSYTISCNDARRLLGIDLKPRLNAGMILRPRDSIDLTQVEQILTHPEVAIRSGHVEQTLQALCASASGRVDYLPDDYALDMDRPLAPENLVCRHYAGASKRFVNTEALAWLWNHGLRT